MEMQAVIDQIIRDILQSECPRARFKHAYTELYGTGTRSPGHVSDAFEENISRVMRAVARLVGVKPGPEWSPQDNECLNQGAD